MASVFYFSWFLLVIHCLAGAHSQQCPYEGSQNLLFNEAAVLTVDCGRNTTKLSWTPPGGAIMVQSVFVYSSCLNVSKAGDRTEVLDTKSIEFDRSFGARDPTSPDLTMAEGPAPTSVDEICLYFGCYRRRGLFVDTTFYTFETKTCTFNRDSTVSSSIVMPSSTIISSSSLQTLITSPPTPSTSAVVMVTTSTVNQMASGVTTSEYSAYSAYSTVSISSARTDTTSSESASSSVNFTPTMSSVPSIRTESLLIAVLVPVVCVVLLISFLVVMVMIYLFCRGRENKFRFVDHTLPLKRPFKIKHENINGEDPIDISLPRKILTLSQPTLYNSLEFLNTTSKDGNNHAVQSFHLNTHFGPSIEDLHKEYNFLNITDSSEAQDHEAIDTTNDCIDIDNDNTGQPMSARNRMFQGDFQYNFSRESGEYIEMDIALPMSPIHVSEPHRSGDTWDSGIATTFTATDYSGKEIPQIEDDPTLLQQLEDTQNGSVAVTTIDDVRDVRHEDSICSSSQSSIAKDLESKSVSDIRRNNNNISETTICCSVES